MKRFHTRCAAVMAATLVALAGAAAAGVVVREVPLQWQDIAHNEGDVLYARLCASCHGASGKGDGLAAVEMYGRAPDLTVLAVNNGGVYPHRAVIETIYGADRTASHRTVNMPAWGEQFMYVGRGWHAFPRRKLASDRIEALALHVERLQVD